MADLGRAVLADRGPPRGGGIQPAGRRVCGRILLAVEPQCRLRGQIADRASLVAAPDGSSRPRAGGSSRGGDMGVLPARRLSAGLAMRRAVPYLLGLFHLAAFHALFRFHRGSFLGGDSGEFLRITETLRSGAPAADAAKPLGYPLAVAALGWLPGGDIAHAPAVNAACYLGTIALIGAIARRLGCAPGQARIPQTLLAPPPNCAA